MTVFAERIGGRRILPLQLYIDHRCHTILKRTLRALPEQDGCALLLGKREKESYLEVSQVWPCCNVFESGRNLLPGSQIVSLGSKLSVRNCFFVDPREQIAAQRWSRNNNMDVIGVAHSHPNGPSYPSFLDCQWGQNNSLMLIQDQYGEIRAWWMTKYQVSEVFIKFCNYE